jgi:hypothetical protein
MAGRAWTSEFGGCLFVLQTCYNRGCVQQENVALSPATMRAHCFRPKPMTGGPRDRATSWFHASTAFRISIPYLRASRSGLSLTAPSPASDLYAKDQRRTAPVK